MPRQELGASGGAGRAGGASGAGAGLGSSKSGASTKAHASSAPSGGASRATRLKLGIALALFVVAGIVFAAPSLFGDRGPTEQEAAAAAQAAKINQAVSESTEQGPPPEPSRAGLQEKVSRRPIQRPQ